MNRAESPAPLTASTRVVRAIGWMSGLLVCHLLASSAFWASVGADHNLARNDANFHAKPAHLQLVITGDSHARNAIAAGHLAPRSVNVAIGGSSIIKINHRLPHLLDSGKTVDTVLLTADDHVFVHKERNEYHPVALWGRHIDFLQLAREFDEPKPMWVNWFRAKAMPYVDELPLWVTWLRGTRSHFRNQALTGRMDQLTPRKRMKNSLQRFDGIFGDEEIIDPLKRDYYDRTIADLHRRGIRVVLVRYPVMKVHNKLLEARGVRDVAQAEINRIAEDERILVLDFHNLYDDNPAFFDDVDHLNIMGRKHFTTHLQGVLLAHGLITVEE